MFISHSVSLWTYIRFRGVLPKPAVLALLCASLTTFTNTAFAQQGTFVPTGSMSTNRSRHTATLLNDGKVLIAGGFDATSNTIRLANADLYDLTTGTFTPTGAMSTARDGHTATLLNDGKVLIAGGFDNSGNALATAELYDPTTG